ncbi:hypothetical protein MTR67_031484 [Solanum verrucosum]|uniref:CCHC-type domain-containing protein n=1 Tax=Solanum verrucosum TaxID=315347 RepID=A0AAF0U2K9_SOLVR|nr:hypothetical protein MTR67_031484 [Solanum verrucosum]
MSRTKDMQIYLSPISLRALTSCRTTKGNVNRLSFQQRQKGLAPSSASAPAPRNRGEYNGQNSQNFRAKPAQSHGSVAQRGNWAAACAKCGRTHPRKCREGHTCCFKCGQEGHFLKECPKNRQVPTENVGIKDNLSYEEIPIQILDRQVRKLRTKEVASVKVLWRNQIIEEATWEAEEDMKKRYPHLFETGENAD